MRTVAVPRGCMNLVRRWPFLVARVGESEGENRKACESKVIREEQRLWKVVVFVDGV